MEWSRYLEERIETSSFILLWNLSCCKLCRHELHCDGGACQYVNTWHWRWKGTIIWILCKLYILRTGTVPQTCHSGELFLLHCCRVQLRHPVSLSGWVEVKVSTQFCGNFHNIHRLLNMVSPMQWGCLSGKIFIDRRLKLSFAESANIVFQTK